MNTKSLFKDRQEDEIKTLFNSLLMTTSVKKMKISSK